VYLIFLLFKIAQKTQDLFGRLVVTGVGIWITAQAVINIAVVLDMLPVLGVPLPLISAGGSSLLALLGAVGLVLAVERDNHAGRPMGTMPKRFSATKPVGRR
jgi:cell division protein FtsW (lipid II flippase)